MQKHTSMGKIRQFETVRRHISHWSLLPLSRLRTLTMTMQTQPAAIDSREHILISRCITHHIHQSKYSCLLLIFPIQSEMHKWWQSRLYSGWYIAMNPFSTLEKQDAAWTYVHWKMQTEEQLL